VIYRTAILNCKQSITVYITAVHLLTYRMDSLQNKLFKAFCITAVDLLIYRTSILHNNQSITFYIAAVHLLKYRNSILIKTDP